MPLRFGRELETFIFRVKKGNRTSVIVLPIAVILRWLEGGDDEAHGRYTGYIPCVGERARETARWRKGDRFVVLERDGLARVI